MSPSHDDAFRERPEPDGARGRPRGKPRPPASSRALMWAVIVLIVAGAVLISSGVLRSFAPDPAPSQTPTGSAMAGALEPGTDSRPLEGLTIALDPGHNGRNADNPALINARVPDGRGGVKACNTAGTTSASGYPEHAFTWDVAVRTRALLEAAGAVVVMTRDDDDGVGPCVDVRGAFAQEHDAAAIVSIHANGSDDAAAHGFFAMVSSPPLNEAQGEPSRVLAARLVEALAAEGFEPSSRYPSGRSERSDLAGLNHAERPAVMLELGEMRNAGDAAVMQSADGRQRYAVAIAAGLTAWAAAA